MQKYIRATSQADFERIINEQFEAGWKVVHGTVGLRIAIGANSVTERYWAVVEKKDAEDVHVRHTGRYGSKGQRVPGKRVGGCSAHNGSTQPPGAGSADPDGDNVLDCPQGAE